MTQETYEWLNSMILSGMESTHGKPWWFDASKANPANHFDGAIPVDAVAELFGFIVDPQPIFTLNAKGEMFQVEGFKAQVPNDANAVLGIHSDSFTGHQYREWLIDGPAKLVNGTTGISSAGLLKNRAQAWVQVSTPETWKTPQGVEFRSNLLCTTSFDGSIASTFKLTNQLTICDNTREAALRSSGKVYKVKHTRNSSFSDMDAKVAFGLIEDEAKAFASEIETLCGLKVTDAQFERFMSQLVPMPDIADKDINKRDYSTRTATIAANKRERLNELYRADGRVAPWTGTAFGVLQMVNTFNTHEATQRGATDGRHARNMENVISGRFADQDNDAMAMLAKICDWHLNLVAA